MSQFKELQQAQIDLRFVLDRTGLADSAALIVGALQRKAAGINWTERDVRFFAYRDLLHQSRSPHYSLNEEQRDVLIKVSAELRAELENHISRGGIQAGPVAIPDLAPDEELTGFVRRELVNQARNNLLMANGTCSRTTSILALGRIIAAETGITWSDFKTRKFIQGTSNEIPGKQELSDANVIELCHLTYKIRLALENDPGEGRYPRIDHVFGAATGYESDERRDQRKYIEVARTHMNFLRATDPVLYTRRMLSSLVYNEIGVDWPTDRMEHILSPDYFSQLGVVSCEQAKTLMILTAGLRKHLQQSINARPGRTMEPFMKAVGYGMNVELALTDVQAQMVLSDPLLADELRQVAQRAVANRLAVQPFEEKFSAAPKAP